MSAAAAECRLAMENRRAGPQGTLTITSSIVWPYSTIYRRFAHAYPNIRFSLRVTNTRIPLGWAGRL